MSSGVCPKHGCEYTGFLTSFCPRCVEEEDAAQAAPAKAAQQSDEFYYYASSQPATKKGELVLSKYSLLFLSEADASDAAKAKKVAYVQRPTYVYRIPRKAVKPHARGFHRIVPTSGRKRPYFKVNTDLIGVPVEIVKTF